MTVKKTVIGFSLGTFRYFDRLVKFEGHRGVMYFVTYIEIPLGLAHCIFFISKNYNRWMNILISVSEWKERFHHFVEGLTGPPFIKVGCRTRHDSGPSHDQMLWRTMIELEIKVLFFSLFRKRWPSSCHHGNWSTVQGNKFSSRRPWYSWAVRSVTSQYRLVTMATICNIAIQANCLGNHMWHHNTG